MTMLFCLLKISKKKANLLNFMDFKNYSKTFLNYFLKNITLKRLLFTFSSSFNLNEKKKLRYLLVGIWNSIFPYIVFAFLYFITDKKLNYLIILTLCQVAGLTNAFICYKFFVFKTKGNVLAEYFKFYLIYGFSFLINLSALSFFVGLCDFNPLLSQGVIAIFIIIMTYFAHDRFSFSNRYTKK